MLPPLLTLALKTYSKLIWLITKPEACTHYYGLCQSMSFQLSGVFLFFFSFGFSTDTEQHLQKAQKVSPQQRLLFVCILIFQHEQF